MKRYFLAILWGSMLLNLSGCNEQEKTRESEIFQTNVAAPDEKDGAEEKGAEKTEIRLDITETSEDEGDQETEQGETGQGETKQGEMGQGETEQGETKQGEMGQGETKAKTEPGLAEDETGSLARMETGAVEEPESEQSSFYGTWKVKDYQACNVSALSEQEIQAFCKNQVTYYEDHFLENGAMVETENFGYEFAYCTIDELRDGYRVDLSGWQKENTEIMEGIISDLNECFGKYFFVAGQDSLWVYYEGVFFQMERAG